MKFIRDCFGRSVRLTDERTAHVLQHQEMAEMAAEIERVSNLQRRYVSRDRITQYGCFMSIMPGRWLVGNGCVSW